MKQLIIKLLSPKPHNFKFPDSKPKGISHTIVDYQYLNLYPVNDLSLISKNIQVL